MRSLISQIFTQINGPTTLLSDNQSEIALAKDTSTTRGRSISMRGFTGQVRLVYCTTDDMIADSEPFHHRKSRTLRPNSGPTRRLCKGECVVSPPFLVN
jgi:hypothetical protein